MTPKEQKAFVRNLMNSIRNTVLSHADKWPEGWDGHELRWLVTEAVEHNAGAKHLTPKRDRRYKDYANVGLNENLF